MGGSDRIELTWPDGAIVGTWLQVTVATTNTGLTAPDVFEFGNAPGETGNDPAHTFVDGNDFAAARDDPHNFLNRASITNVCDFNRDSFVDGTDLAIVRDNNTNFLTALRLLAAPASTVQVVATGASISLVSAVPASPASGLAISVNGAGDLSQLLENHRNKCGTRSDSAAIVAVAPLRTVVMKRNQVSGSKEGPKAEDKPRGQLGQDIAERLPMDVASDSDPMHLKTEYCPKETSAK